MAKDSPLHIFHASAKKKKEPISKNTKSPKATAEPVRNLEIAAMIDRMHEMRQEIDDKLDALTTTHGISKELLKQYLSNPGNFTKEQWEFIQQRNQEMAEKIWSTVEPITQKSADIPSLSGSSAQTSSPVTSSATTTQPISQEKVPLTKRSKFSRRKWIPTR